MKEIKIKDESGDKEFFTIIPNYILNHSTHWDREVYIQMKRIAGENGKCFMSIKRLQKQCGISKERLTTSIKYLLEHNWINYIGKTKYQTVGGEQEINTYTINNLWKTNSVFYKGGSPNDTPCTKGGSPNVTKGGRQIVKGGSPDDHKEELYNKNNIKKIDFSIFWNLYDKKTDKVWCENKWNSLKLSEQQEITRTLPSYVKSTFTNGKFPSRKNPKTYLNNKCWEDEVEEKKIIW